MNDFKGVRCFMYTATVVEDILFLFFNDIILLTRMELSRNKF